MPPFEARTAADIFTDNSNSAPPSPTVSSRKGSMVPPPRPRANSSSSGTAPTPPRQRTRLGSVPSSPVSSISNVSSSHRLRSSTTGDIGGVLESAVQRNPTRNSQPAAPLDAEQAIKKAIKQGILNYGEKHPSIAQLYVQMGNLQFRQGNLDNAESAYNLAVQSSGGDPSEHLSSAYLNLGTVYWRSGDIPKSIQFLKHSLRVNELYVAQQGKSLEESTAAASVHHQLGVCYALSSDWTNALNSLEQARSIRVRVAGPMDVAVGQTMDAIGKVYFMQGMYDEAKDCHQQALTSLQAAGVADTASTLQSIANVHIALGSATAALTVLQEVCKVQQVVGIKSTAKAALHCQTLKMMAKLYEETGSPDHSQRLRQQADTLEQEAGLS